ncbi:MAG TPA: LytTR family DNA-binding domain-containing protein [Chitinophagaceae bacterium]
MIRTIIIDDEPSAISVLSTLLQKYCRDDIDLLASTNTPEEGKSLIEELHPDLVFMDVEMPGMSGVELIRRFNSPTFRVVVVTAYDAYAVEAFRVNAVDYLLKPISSDDVISVVQKVKNDVRNELGRLTIQLESLDKLLNNRPGGADQKVGIAMSDKIVFINFSDIIYCEANGTYTHAYLVDGRKLVSSKPLGEFEAQLGTSRFFRIHHHYLINLNQVKEFQRSDGGYVIMDNGKKLEVSQRKRRDFLEAINDYTI